MGNESIENRPRTKKSYDHVNLDFALLGANGVLMKMDWVDQDLHLFSLILSSN